MSRRDRYSEARASEGLAAARIGEQDFTLILRYDDVKRVARDWQHFTSATPFRVPIPEESELRSVPQYPIETDPPEHRLYRGLIEERFSRGAAEKHLPAIVSLVDGLVKPAIDVGAIEVVEGLALPAVALGIAATMGFPEDADRIRSWGLDVFKDPRTGERHKNDDMDRYLAERVDAAFAASVNGVFGELTRAEFGDRKLTRDEVLGFGYLILAGGRDTVIGAMAGALWHLGTHNSAQATLRADPSAIPRAVEEYLRYFSPLAHIGRTVVEPAVVAGRSFEVDELVSLCFASANHDENVFEDPGHCLIDRKPNRHVAFGHGPHTCIGAPLARMQVAAVLERFLSLVPSFSVIEPLEWPTFLSQTSTVSGPPTRLALKLDRG